MNGIFSNYLINRLFNVPGGTAVEQVIHVMDLGGGLFVGDDLVKAVVEGRGFHIADDADGDREMRRCHVGEHHVEASVLDGLIVDQDVLLSDAVLADGDHFELVTVQADTLVTVLAEDQRLTMDALHLHVLADVLAGNVLVHAIGENHAVLQDLGHGDAIVVVRLHEDFGEFLGVDIHATGEEGRLGADGEFTRIERIFVGTLR